MASLTTSEHYLRLGDLEVRMRPTVYNNKEYVQLTIYHAQTEEFDYMFTKQELEELKRFLNVLRPSLHTGPSRDPREAQ